MKITLDDFDTKILGLLKKNSRLSYAEMGRTICLSQSATKERVQNLIDAGIIKNFSVEIDYKLLGYNLKVVLLLKFKNDEFRTFLNNLHQFPEIIECKRITGEHCLVADCLLKDSSDLEDFIDRLIFYGIPSTHIVLSEIKNSILFNNEK